MLARFEPLSTAAFVLTLCHLTASAASFRTQNFIVSARDPVFARQICEAAEQYRAELAYEWLGQALPAWPEPCPITVQDGPQLGAGGATSFSFDRGRPCGWTMNIQGSRERILDSVLPHEVTHTVFATHFGQPVPRWADEGACTTVEHASEREKQHQLLLQFLTTNRGIPFNKMFRLTEYPHDIMPLYSQGHSVAQYLVAQGGRRRFIEFVGRGMSSHDWDAAVDEYYGFRDLSDLQLTWVDWVREGCPQVEPRRAAGPRASAWSSSERLTAGEHGRDANWRSRQSERGLARSSPKRAGGPVSLRASEQLVRAQSAQASQSGQTGFGPPSVIATRSAARAQDIEQTQERVLEWDARPRSPLSGDGVARAPGPPTQYSSAATSQWR